LQLLYVDCVKCPGFKYTNTDSPLTFWTAERLKNRETYEMNNGGFGMGDLGKQHVNLVDYNDIDKSGIMRVTDDGMEDLLMKNVDDKDFSVSFMRKNFDV
jgi:hypothetical protein